MLAHVSYAGTCTIQPPTRITDDSRDVFFDEPTLLKDCKFVFFTFFSRTILCIMLPLSRCSMKIDDHALNFQPKFLDDVCVAICAI